MSEASDRLQPLAEFLAQLPLRPDAEAAYDLLDGGIFWSDERPPGSISKWDPHPLSRVWHFRTELILGEHDAYNEPYWIAAKELFPTWPGFAPERCSPTLHDYVLKLQDEWQEKERVRKTEERASGKRTWRDDAHILLPEWLGPIDFSDAIPMYPPRLSASPQPPRRRRWPRFDTKDQPKNNFCF